MNITYENLNAFAQKHGTVSYLDAQSSTRKLTSGDPDSFDLVAKANWFLFDGKWYSRTDFERLMDERA